MDTPNHITNSTVVKILVISLAIISPFLCYFVIGPLPSYSHYWDTPMRPLFIFTNATTSYYLFSMKKWWIPSSLLLLVTAFSNDQYFIIHNVVAVLFFIVSVWAIITGKRGRGFIIPYLIGVMYLAITKNIFWAETIGICTMCLYHLYPIVLLYFYKKI